MPDGPRSYDAAIKQRARELVAQEAERHTSDFERAAAEQIQVLEYAAADKTAEIHWAAAEHRESLAKVAAARSAEHRSPGGRARPVHGAPDPTPGLGPAFSRAADGGGPGADAARTVDRASVVTASVLTAAGKPGVHDHRHLLSRSAQSSARLFASRRPW